MYTNIKPCAYHSNQGLHWFCFILHCGLLWYPSCYLESYLSPKRVSVNGLVSMRNNWASVALLYSCMTPQGMVLRSACQGSIFTQSERERVTGRRGELPETAEKCQGKQNRKCGTQFPALRLWSRSQHRNADDPIYLLALTEWTETTILAQKWYSEEAISIAHLDPS